MCVFVSGNFVPRWHPLQSIGVLFQNTENTLISIQNNCFNNSTYVDCTSNVLIQIYLMSLSELTVLLTIHFLLFFTSQTPSSGHPSTGVHRTVLQPNPSLFPLTSLCLIMLGFQKLVVPLTSPQQLNIELACLKVGHRQQGPHGTDTPKPAPATFTFPWMLKHSQPARIQRW